MLKRCLALALLCVLLAAIVTAATTVLCDDILHWMKAPEDTYSYA